MTAPAVQMSSKSTITQKEQTKETSAGSRELYDSNFQLNAKENAEDEKKTNAYFQSVPNGVIGKYVIRSQTDDGKNVYNNTTVDLYLPDLDMNPIAVYSSTSSEYNPMPEQHKFPDTTMLSLPDRVLPIARRTFSDYPVNNNDPLKLNNLITPQMGPRYYIAQHGDSLESIAQLFKVNVKDLARLNGYNENTTLLAGHELKLPCSIPVYNKFNSHVSYQNFINAIRGSLFPHLPLPHVVSQHHHHEFVGILVKALALGILLSVAPAIAASLLTAGGIAASGLTLDVATAAIGAIEDAAVQKTAIGLGIQNKFSSLEMLETAINAGTSSLLNKSPNLPMLLFNQARVQISTQLAEISLGLRSQFDARAVATQLAASTVNYELNGMLDKSFLAKYPATLSYVKRGSDTLAGAALGKAITKTPIQVEALAANAIGSTIGNKLGESAIAMANLHPEVGATRPKVATAPRKIGPKYENKDTVNAEKKRFIDEMEKTNRTKLMSKNTKKAGASVERPEISEKASPEIRMSDASLTNQESVFMQGVEIFNYNMANYVAPAIGGAVVAVGALAASEVLIPIAFALADTISIASLMAVGVPISEGVALNGMASAGSGALVFTKGVSKLESGILKHGIFAGEKKGVSTVMVGDKLEGVVISDKRVGHIFRDKPGHLPNTSENHRLLKSIAEDSSAILGKDKFGNVWLAKTNADGTQVWAQTRNGEIINGGLNLKPKVYHPETGLSSPFKPKN